MQTYQAFVLQGTHKEMASELKDLGFKGTLVMTKRFAIRKLNIRGDGSVDKVHEDLCPDPTSAHIKSRCGSTCL